MRWVNTHGEVVELTENEVRIMADFSILMNRIVDFEVSMPLFSDGNLTILNNESWKAWRI